MADPHPAIAGMIGDEGSSVAIDDHQEPAVIPARQVMDEADAADYLRVTQRTLEGWRAKGYGPAYAKDARTRRIWYFKQDLDDWLQARRVVPEASKGD